MNFDEFVKLLALNIDTVLALAAFMALGVGAIVQALKVFRVITTEEWAGRAAMITAGVEGVLVVLGYVFPAFVPFGLIVYGTALSAASAGLGYKYVAKPGLEKLFGNLFSVSDLNNEPLVVKSKK